MDRVGLEPTNLSIPGLKSGALTNSAICPINRWFSHLVLHERNHFIGYALRALNDDLLKIYKQHKQMTLISYA